MFFKIRLSLLQLLRAIGETYYKGADIGECLSTAYRIKEGDFESWHQEWLKTAKRVHKYADESFAAGHKVSAREAYLRASNYYNAAEFLLGSRRSKGSSHLGKQQRMLRKSSEAFLATTRACRNTV